MPKKYRRTRRSSSGRKKKRKSSSWKALKKRFQVKRKLRRAGLGALVFLSVVLTLLVIYVWRYLTRPFAEASGTFDSDVSWEGEAPLNLLWLEVDDLENETASLADFRIISINPTLDRLAIFSLPLDYEVDLPSQGEQPLKSLYGVGNLMEEDKGVELCVKNASYLLGIPVSGYFLVESQGLEELEALFGSTSSIKDLFLIKNITHFPKVVGIAHGHMRTNLNLAELGRAVYFAWTVRADKVDVLDIKPSYLDDPSVLDGMIHPFVKDAVLIAERLKVQVLNGTIQPGLAGFAARVVRNMGGEAIRVGNYERQDLTKGFLVLEESGSYTAKRLARVFGVVDSRRPKSSSEKRADITLILGMENFDRIF